MGKLVKSRNLLILGAGQYGQLVREIAAATERFDRIAFLDDNHPAALGKLADYEGFSGEYAHALVAMGNPGLRLRWLEKLEQAGFALPVLIHPKAYVSPSALLEKGTIVEPMAVVHTEAKVGIGTLLCVGCVVNHNSTVGKVCQIDCGAVVAANATVPEATKISSGVVFSK